MNELSQLEEYNRLLEQQLRQSETERLKAQQNYGHMSAFSPENTANLVEQQLDLRQDLDRVHHILSGHVLERDSKGSEVWKEPTDDRLKIFSDFGVKVIMNIILMYMNKNTLLSNYEMDQINIKMYDFGMKLNNLIYTRYESIFYYPTPEELYDKYHHLIKKNNLNISDIDLYAKCVQWSKEELQHRLRHFPMTLLTLMDSVHSTYLRALNGEERETLRKIIHVSQNANQYNDMPSGQTQKWSLFKPSTWGKS